MLKTVRKYSEIQRKTRQNLKTLEFFLATRLAVSVPFVLTMVKCKCTIYTGSHFIKWLYCHISVLSISGACNL